jgi:small-conductance mechanosensitive channel
VIIRCLYLLIWLFTATLPFAAAAQSPEDVNQQLAGMDAVLDTIDSALKREGLTSDQLVDRRRQAEEIAVEAQAIVTALRPSVEDLTKRREALKPAVAADGEAAQTTPESDEIVNERAEVEEALAGVSDFSKRAAATATRATQLVARAAAVERDRFARMIFERDRSILDPGLWRAFIADLPPTIRRVERVLGDIVKRFASKGPLGFLPPLFFLSSLLLVAVPRFRHGMVDLVAKRFGQEKPTEFSKAVVACLVAVFVTLVPFVGISLALWTANFLALSSPSLLELLDRAGVAILILSASIGFARALLAPNRPDWRIVAVDDAVARKLGRRIRTVAVIVAVGVFLEGVAAAVNASQPVIVLIGSFIAMAVAWALALVLKPYREILNDEANHHGASGYGHLGLLRLIGMVGTLLEFVILGGVLLGYIPLAWFLSKQIVWFSIILAGYILIALLLDSAGSVVQNADGWAARRIARRTGVRSTIVAQFGIVAFGLAKLLLAGFGIILVVAPWGFRSVGIPEQASILLTGFQIGELNISLSKITVGIVLFLLGLFFTRSIKSWLDDRYLPTTSLDQGLKNSITTTAGYLGFILAAVVAFSFVGIDLSQLGLVAGALSVGIGFGLQSIVNNFVSGLILLAERPIKAGDWIIVGGEEGTVKKINVRATELETFDRASVVIPNSDLISGTVRNWVLGGTMGRVSLFVGVGYGSDADQVREILLACAEDHELALAFPEPAVFFIDFGDSALMFRLDVYLADIGKGFGVRSDLRFDLLRRFREAGIEVPFPQRDLNIRSSDELTNLIDRAKGSEA